MFHDIFDDNEPLFDRKLVNKNILILKKGVNPIELDKAKVNLFKLMKKVIVKNVKNYSKLSRNSPVHEDCLDEEEMYAEAYIVMIKCVENFKINKKNCFYFYFNKSLSRNFYRMFDKEIRKKENFNSFESYSINSSNSSINDELYGVEMVIDSLDLDEFDKRVVLSKLDYQKKDDFIVNNEDATVSKYYASIRKIKIQLQKLIEDGEL